MAQIMELVCGKPLSRILPYYLKMLFAKYGVSMSISDVSVTTYLNIPNLRPEKGGLGPLRAKGPELGVIITNLRWPMA